MLLLLNGVANMVETLRSVHEIAIILSIPNRKARKNNVYCNKSIHVCLHLLWVLEVRSDITHSLRVYSNTSRVWLIIVTRLKSPEHCDSNCTYRLGYLPDPYNQVSGRDRAVRDISSPISSIAVKSSTLAPMLTRVVALQQQSVKYVLVGPYQVPKSWSQFEVPMA